MISFRRNYVSKDLDSIVRIENECFVPGKAYSRELLRSLFESPNSTFFIAEADGRICGFILGEAKGSDGYMSTLDVALDFRRQHLGQKLVSELESSLKARGCIRMKLEVAVDNSDAISMYEKLGYKRVKRHEDFYSDGTAAFEYAKAL